MQKEKEIDMELYEAKTGKEIPASIKDDYIDNLKEELGRCKAKNACLSKQVESALASKCEVDKRLNDLKREINVKVGYLIKQIECINDTVNIIFKGEI